MARAQPQFQGKISNKQTNIKEMCYGSRQFLQDSI